MNWVLVSGITLVVVLIAVYEWPKIGRNQKKEKAAFAVLLGMGWLLAVLLIFNPEMPGPTELIDRIYKPLGRYLEK